MQLNPIKTSRLIKSSYVNYLKTLFPINDPEIERLFHKMLEDEDKLFKGPYLESTPPYLTGKNIKELQNEKILSPLFDILDSKYLPADRLLYLHQEKAIGKIVNGRNLIVATGTGSGKTEAFLIPIFNHLLTEKDKGTLCPGVRALLLYPMNALANDQVKRLRQLLTTCPDITFGRYIGETVKDKNRAREDYNKTYNEKPLDNERLSREEMQESPPHILLTNYAMLEYLLLRPDDNVFFDGQHSRHWKFIVMDEVHTYDGAKGIETAMLLRRLKDRILKGNHNQIQCIGTSATVGGEEKDIDKIARFGSQLFSEPFKYDEKDESRQDVVLAERLEITTASKEKWFPAPEFYNKLNEYIESADEPDLSTLLEIAKTFNVPEGISLSVSKSNISHLTEQKEKYKIWIYILLKDDERLHALHKLLKEPKSLKDISDSLKISKEHLVSFVNLAVRAKSGKNDAPLLPARYHFFVKALEGGFVTFSPDKKLFLNPETKRIEDGEEYPVFEMATCKKCGSIYLVGEEKDNKLLQAKGITEDNIEKAAFYHVRPDITLPDEDEDIAEEVDEEIHEEEYILCAGCGAIAKTSLYDQDICTCTSSKKHLMKLFKASDSGGKIKRCPSCGTRGNVVYRFLTGQDAPASVLTTALYQEIPEREIEMQPKSQEDSGWEDTEIKKSRKLLIFSDSRQDAAYFAPYLGDITYQPILWRRLIVEILNKKADEIIRDNWTIGDFVEPLRRRASEANLFEGASIREQKIQVGRWLIKEFTSLERRISLEGVGLIKFKLIKPQNVSPISIFFSQSPWCLNEDEAWELCEALIGSFRLQSAIEFPEDISPEDEFFSPRNREYFFRISGASHKRHIYSWLSTSQGKRNKRMDFLLKLLKSCSGNEDIQKCNEALQKIWDGITNQNSPLRNCFEAKQVSNEGYVYQLKMNAYKIVPNYKNHITWFRCNRCGNLTNINIRNVCPTYQCTGELKPCIPEQELRNNHYRKLYHDLKPIPMVCKEHTAQLTGKRASQLQTDFMQGKVNIISCSTTFELGVDVGSLESVMMRNVPPSPSNYIQRAGRAGRRTDSAAFSLTYCQRRPHDLSYFAEPLKIIKGEIKPPVFEVKNEKIIRRHMHSAVFSSFWRDNKELFGKVKDFFFDINEKEIKSLDEFKKEHPIFSFLQKRPKEIEHALRNIVPEELHSALNLETWGWLKELIDDKDGSLMKAADMVYSEVAFLEQERERLVRENKRSDFILGTIKTIKDRPIIEYLSSKNVLPKYGFPVDVVELELNHHGIEATGLELQRDLRIALSEYAPSSQVVAGGRLWTSYGLKCLPKREWKRYIYVVCGNKNCNTYQRQILAAETAEDIEKIENNFRKQLCTNCSRPLSDSNPRTFIVPEFGFITKREAPKKPGSSRPERTYTSRIYYSGESGSEAAEPVMKFGDVSIHTKIISSGYLAVINRAGFKVCKKCGYAVKLATNTTSHKNYIGNECRGSLGRYDLGHEFSSDILRIDFEGITQYSEDFWLSLLYALLEGASDSLSIIRSDLDGCLYPHRASPNPAIILFDNVPGGAGHVKRIAKPEGSLLAMFEAAFNKVSGKCGCGGGVEGEGDTSCYGCLQNYQNQLYHDKLKRRLVKEFIENNLF